MKMDCVINENPIYCRLEESCMHWSSIEGRCQYLKRKEEADREKTLGAELRAKP